MSGLTLLVTSGSVLVTGRSSRLSRSSRLGRSSGHTNRHGAILRHQGTSRRTLRKHGTGGTLGRLNRLNVSVQQNILSGQSGNRLILGQTHQRGDLHLTRGQDNVHGATGLNRLSALVVRRTLLGGQLNHHTGRHRRALHSGDAAIHQTKVLQSVTHVSLALTLQVIGQLDLLRAARNGHGHSRTLVDLRTNTRLDANHVALLNAVRVSRAVVKHEAQVTQLIIGIIAGNVHDGRHRHLRNLIQLVLVVQDRTDAKRQQCGDENTHQEARPCTLTG